MIMTQFFGLMLDPFVDGRARGFGAAAAQSASRRARSEIAARYGVRLRLDPQQGAAEADLRPALDRLGLGLWRQQYGQRRRGVGSSNVTAQTFGFAAGMDYHVAPNTILGFALAGGGTNWGLPMRWAAAAAMRCKPAPTASARARLISPARSPSPITGSRPTARRSAISSRANFIGQSYGARLEGGYRFGALPTLGVTPYAAVQAQDFHTPAYSESDPTSGGFGLSYDAMNATDVRTEIGSRFDAPTMVAGMPLISAAASPGRTTSSAIRR